MSRAVLAWVAVFALGSSACRGGGGEGTTPSPTGAEPALADGMPQGLFLMGLALEPVGGLVLPFQLDLEAVETDAGTVFSRFDLRAVGEDDAVSDVLASMTDLAVDPATGFVAELPPFTLPAAYNTVTGSDVDVTAVLTGEGVSADGVCGSVSGELVTFGLDLAGSTFGTVAWDQRGDDAPAACDAAVIEEIPRIATCPTLTDGVNTGFPSGGQLRDFDVALPSTYDPLQSYPIVFVYHGFGGTSGDMLDGTGLRPYADAMDVILVAPQGMDLGGSTGWDTFSDPRTNLDLVLFDDLVTCASASFSVDPQRVHVTGMSNGGLETGYLIASRAGVIASAAPMSGGLGIDLVDAGYPMPALVVWGGTVDQAFDLDFNQLALDMIADLRGDGRFVLGCDHGLGHTLDPSFWPWVLQFLVDHPRDLASEPYVGGLPAVFPSYCVIE